MNEGFMATSRIPRGQPAEVAGLPTGDRHEIRLMCPLQRLAWTIDDGPTKYTDAMANNFPKFRPATWYIQYNNLKKRPEFIDKYLSWQNDLGHEIAIHGLHPTRDHLAWFPGTSMGSYSSIDDAMDGLGNFVNFLDSHGIRVKFVRLPYGLFTEIVGYLRQIRGSSNAVDVEKVARAIIGGGEVPEWAKQVQLDFETLKKKLHLLGLHEWGGSGAGRPEIGYNSWEAESAAPGTSRSKNDNVPGGQIRHINDLKNGKRESSSFVILAHDTTEGDVVEVKSDIDAIEKAAGNYVGIHYLTVSGLYRVVRGSDP